MTGWTSYVALGDSFSEGVGDPLADGSLRGWADLVAGGLGIRYANLAVRGRRLDEIVGSQVGAAIELGPDLVSLTAGGNDALRPGFDAADLMNRFEAAVELLTTSGATVLLFRFPDLSARLPLRRILRPRIAAMNEAISALARRHGALVVDLAADPALDSPALWSADRIHLNAAGHRRVAEHVLAVLNGVEPEPATVPAAPAGSGGSDLRWALDHLRPWLGRRLRGRSSGDGLGAKRPEPAPMFSGGQTGVR
ncbi:SGNH/GDSL hydrolase family protein [Actinocorallia longicatena]|uniref:SGNH/GDSL hydrolase family protein n=1 Tax=Actinocorallia longicatena TaxID=111803 RepID=A0ABP6Q9A1_9ACTN